jgi:hypothetical protein
VLLRAPLEDVHLLRDRLLCSGWASTPCGKVRKPYEIYAKLRGNAFAGICLAFALPVVAWADPPAITPEADVLHELRARQTLLSDRQLAPLNLGVSVRRHVAVLWGPIPSAVLRKRAIEALKQLPELMEVRDELHVQPTEEAAPAVARGTPLRPPALPDVPRGPAASSGFLMKHSAALPQSSPSPVGNPQWRPADAEGPLLPAIDVPRPSATALDDDGLDDGLIQTVTRVQRSEPQFQRLRVEVRGKTVRLDGAVERWSDAQELAQRIGRLTGVERVVLGDIRTRH